MAAAADTQPSKATRVPSLIRKDAAGLRVMPNLRDYQATCAGFRWEGAQALLDGLPAWQGLNMAHEAVDRHLDKGRAEKIALERRKKYISNRESDYERHHDGGNTQYRD